MRNKKNVIIAVMVAVALLMATGYAYFATQLNINSVGNITSSWNVHFASISNGMAIGGASNVTTPSVSGTSANMNVNLTLPGDAMMYNIVLKNSGTVGAIIENINAKAEGSSAIIYFISGLNIGDKLAAGASKDITIVIQYDSNTTSQPAETSKKLTVTIDAVQDIGQSITNKEPIVNQPIYLGSTILLNDNIAYADNETSPYVTSSTGIDFSQVSSDTNGKGLYYTSTNTENNERTYYFRGAVENNYVSFGTYKEANGNFNAGDPIIWRIVRINEDGSIRLIKQDSIGSYTYNDAYNDNAYVGYMRGTAGSATYALTHANNTNSAVKGVLDTWYTKHLSSYSSLFAQDAGFCNDRSVATSANTWESNDTALGYGTNITYYGAHNRVELYKPQFKCPNETNDLFTLTTSSKGNNKLTKPIGMLTLDEVIYAGGRIYASNSNYYLVNGDYWWTMSPSNFNGHYASVWRVFDEGDVGSDDALDRIGVRPAINLSSNVEVTLEGTGEPGTITNPYVVKTN